MTRMPPYKQERRVSGAGVDTAMITIQISSSTHHQKALGTAAETCSKNLHDIVRERDMSRRANRSGRRPANRALLIEEIAMTEAAIAHTDATVAKAIQDYAFPLGQLAAMRAAQADLRAYLRGLRFTF